MSEPQEKILAFDNQFHEFGTQTVQGVECVSTPFPVISSDANTLTLELTGLELRELLSSIQVGAEWAYPDKSHQILFNFMKGLICAPVMQEEGDCANYLPYAPFAEYSPQNPYNEPDLTPPDYLMPPFMRNTGFEYPELFGYKASDVFVPFGAVNIAPENVFMLNYPQIKISVRGSGQIELDLLSVQAGGFAVIKVGSPPNILDILQELIIETGVIIIDLENDSASIPPESDIVIAEEINIEAAVNETTDVYVVFIPKLNDSLNALGFGGGIRSIGLCGFEQDAMMAGIEDVRYNELTGGLEKRVDGVWTEFATCEQLVACAPEGGGGGGGGVVALGATYNVTPSANATTASSSYVALNQGMQNHTFTKSNALIGVGWAAAHAVAQSAFLRPSLLKDSVRQNGVNLTEARGFGTSLKELWAWDYFENIPAGVNALEIEGKSSSGTASFVSSVDVQWVVIEFDEISSIFVEDVRIAGRELQKKIGGVWITVSDSLNALFDSIDSQIASIISVNNTQASQITSIQSVNSTQNTRLNALEARATDLETFQEDAELSLAQNALTLIDHEDRIAALEAASGESAYFTEGVWAQNFNFRDGEFGFTATAMSWTNGVGYNFNSDASIGLPTVNILDSRITHVIAKFFRNGVGSDTVLMQFPSLTLQGQLVRTTGGGAIDTRIVKVANFGAIYTPRLYFSNVSASHSLKELTFLGRGSNPFI